MRVMGFQVKCIGTEGPPTSCDSNEKVLVARGNTQSGPHTSVAGWQEALVLGVLLARHSRE